MKLRNQVETTVCDLTRSYDFRRVDSKLVSFLAYRSDYQDDTATLRLRVGKAAESVEVLINLTYDQFRQLLDYMKDTQSDILSYLATESDNDSDD